ncbi:hypothetical protein AVEN_208526-1 [Araneus ventricosus]|uniref:RNase H type-1 domain-containing protein n=1 Tax=Araneus ventricosus TaxID=182803 RepID=A0A4Y2E6I3_ARAVE|nr:hypothetical protein AVEN_208526-1 [Araneus ventricosus]
MVPVSWDECKHFIIRTHELVFQQRNLDPSTIKLMIAECKSLLPPDRIILATDASKNENSTAIVAINCSLDVVIKGTIHNINSVFSGEGFAIALAVMNFIQENKDYFILTDSLSNLSALKYLNFHSPKNSLFLARVIFNALKLCSSLELIYTPAHVVYCRK